MCMLYSISCRWIPVSVTHRGQILYSIYVLIRISLSDWRSCQGEKWNRLCDLHHGLCGCCYSCSCWRYRVIVEPPQANPQQEADDAEWHPLVHDSLDFPMAVYGKLFLSSVPITTVISSRCAWRVIIYMLCQNVPSLNMNLSFHGNAFNRSPTFHRPAATPSTKVWF